MLIFGFWGIPNHDQARTNFLNTLKVEIKFISNNIL